MNIWRQCYHDNNENPCLVDLNENVKKCNIIFSEHSENTKQLSFIYSHSIKSAQIVHHVINMYYIMKCNVMMDNVKLKKNSSTPPQTKDKKFQIQGLYIIL